MTADEEAAVNPEDTALWLLCCEFCLLCCEFCGDGDADCDQFLLWPCAPSSKLETADAIQLLTRGLLAATAGVDALEVHWSDVAVKPSVAVATGANTVQSAIWKDVRAVH